MSEPVCDHQRISLKFDPLPECMHCRAQLVEMFTNLRLAIAEQEIRSAHEDAERAMKTGKYIDTGARHAPGKRTHP